MVCHENFDFFPRLSCHDSSTRYISNRNAIIRGEKKISKAAVRNFAINTPSRCRSFKYSDTYLHACISRPVKHDRSLNHLLDQSLDRPFGIKRFQRVATIALPKARRSSLNRFHRRIHTPAGRNDGRKKALLFHRAGSISLLREPLNSPGSIQHLPEQTITEQHSCRERTPPIDAALIGECPVRDKFRAAANRLSTHSLRSYPRHSLTSARRRVSSLIDSIAITPSRLVI